VLVGKLSSEYPNTRALHIGLGMLLAANQDLPHVLEPELTHSRAEAWRNLMTVDEGEYSYPS